MNLSQLDRDLSRRLNKVNSMLKNQFGFTVSGKGQSLPELGKLRESIAIELSDLRRGVKTPDQHILSKKIMIKEALDIIINRRVSKNRLVEGVNSPQYVHIVDSLANVIARCVMLGDPIDEACSTAMKEYRSSKWRYPDDQIEFDSRNAALLLINDPEFAIELEEEPLSLIPKEVNAEKPLNRSKDAYGEYSGDDRRGASARLNPKQAKMADRILGKNSKLSLEPKDGSPETTRGKKAQFKIDDPFKESVNNLDDKGISEMKNTYVKTLRALLETEVNEAEVMIAAKGFSNDLQEMIEKIGRLQNESLPPLIDQMTDTFGIDAAQSFQQETKTSLDGVMGSLSAAREQLNMSVQAMAKDQLGGIDMDDDFSMDGEMDADLGIDTEMDVDAEVDGELDGLEDEFGGAETEEPLGRAKMEKYNNMKARLAEMKDAMSALKAKRETRSK
jgi:hypothetical protein